MGEGETTRRGMLKAGLGAAAIAALPPSIQRALAIPATVNTGTIQDVQHIVIMMQENRSFDHYFGTLKGVRGYGDRFPIQLASGQPIWFDVSTLGAPKVPINVSSQGVQLFLPEIPPGGVTTPFRYDAQTMNAMFIFGDMPHGSADTQAGWNQGLFGHWTSYKTVYSMGYYERADIPFQYALADAFTICDAYHCSFFGGTGTNRLYFFSGAAQDYDLTLNPVVPCTDAIAEMQNFRTEVGGTIQTLNSDGTINTPSVVNGQVVTQYEYQGSAFTYPSIPDLLQAAGISWRIFQNPNNNFSGLMNGCLPFETFRTSQPGSPIYENGMSLWTIADLTAAVESNTLPQVSWVLPTRALSEHPDGASSPADGASLVSEVLTALTSNPEVWSKTVFFLTYDENDGLLDHMPPPAVPSINSDGSIAGKTTLATLTQNDITREYFSDPTSNTYVFFNAIPASTLAALPAPLDTISGTIRPLGMGMRVPMFVISPWSTGGWVNSQIFDHTSIGQFIEQRFGITIPRINPWRRAVAGNLLSAFNFASPNDQAFPTLPDASQNAATDAASEKLPDVTQLTPPATPEALFQETGVKFSRALPYTLNTTGEVDSTGTVNLTFINSGTQGTVFHVYDRLHLDRIPRRYTVEAGRSLTDNAWNTMLTDSGNYNLWVYGPNGFIRTFQGQVTQQGRLVDPTIDFAYDVGRGGIQLAFLNRGSEPIQVMLTSNAYDRIAPKTLSLAPKEATSFLWPVAHNGNWYDFTVAAGKTFARRFAGRMETGKPSISDPAMGLHLAPRAEVTIS
jgi:phospholipase C